MIRNNARIISEVKEDVLHIAILGEIDHHCAAALREEMDDAILSAMPQRIELDLSTVDFMYFVDRLHKAGLGVIMGRKAAANRIGAEFCLVNPTARIARILELAGLGKVVTILYKNNREGTKQ